MRNKKVVVKNKDELDYEAEQLRKNMESIESNQSETKVGKMLSDLTTRRVIILVLSMLFSVPFLTLTTYKTENTSFQYGLKLIILYDSDTPAFNAMFDSFVSEHEDI